MVGASATQVGVYFMTLTSCSIMVWNRFWVQSSRSLDWKVSKSRVSTPQTYLRLQPFWVVGYWHQRANERHGNPPQGNQELLVIRDKVGRRPGELWVSKSMECDIFPSVSALTLSVGWQEGHPACKKLDVGLLVVMIWLELCTTYSSSCHHHLNHPLLQWTLPQKLKCHCCLGVRFFNQRLYIGGKRHPDRKPTWTATLGWMWSKLCERPAVYPAFAQQAARGTHCLRHSMLWRRLCSLMGALLDDDDDDEPTFTWKMAVKTERENLFWVSWKSAVLPIFWRLLQLRPGLR